MLLNPEYPSGPVDSSAEERWEGGREGGESVSQLVQAWKWAGWWGIGERELCC